MSLSKRLRTLYHAAVDLAALDRHVAGLPPGAASPVVSLTSVPQRIHGLKPTLVSLLRQTRAPKEIQLNLGRDLFAGTSLPRFLDGLERVRVHWTDRDHGPATKFIPALDRYAGTEQLIVVCDDDMFYHPGLLDALCGADEEAGGKHAYCVNGFSVPADLRSASIPSDKAISHGRRRVGVIEGCGGYTLRSRFVDAATLLDLEGAPPRALYDDDIWLSGQLSRRGIEKYQVPAGERRSLVNTIESAISGNRAQLQTDLMTHFRLDWKPTEVAAAIAAETAR